MEEALADMTVPELRAELKARSLKHSGRKVDLIARLVKVRLVGRAVERPCLLHLRRLR